MKHPHIILFLGYYVTETGIDLVLNYCKGGDLSNLLYNTKVELTLSFQLQVLIDVANGINYMHSHNYLHRDIKSQNILLKTRVTNRGMSEAVVSDVGLSKILGSFKSHISNAGKVGTEFWMAPEVITENKSTSKSDVYSFAILMYEVFARKKPFNEHTNQISIMFQIPKGLRPDIKSIINCPNEIIDLIQKCWDNDYNKRPDFDEIIDVLESVQKVEDPYY